jgi:glycosyltransferase involved in cell wall biosynthesis
MKILFGVEFYYPSVGGAQEVVRQLAERLAARGHDVTVATSRLATRDFTQRRGVKIAEFNIGGNLVRGIQGDVASYREHLIDADYDVVFFYAAQQWTFDAAWDALDRIKARKVLVPCGYSGLFESAYREYFEKLPEVLKAMDTVIYHTDVYRDVNFARSLGLTNGALVPNAADGEEFDVPRDPGFRERIGAGENDFMVMTVGTITGMKGHIELVQAFARLDLADPQRKALLILNGNQPERAGRRASVFRTIFSLIKEFGLLYAAKHLLKVVLRHFGWQVGRTASINDWVQSINRQQAERKKVVAIDLPRAELIQAYLNADLFVFASNVEYSPLVLFEACAAGLPFLSVPVGNSAEIADWTGGGEICPAEVDQRGYSHVAPALLARHIAALAADPERLERLGNQGRATSRRRYNWASIVGEYEAILKRLVSKREARPAAAGVSAP